MPGTRGTGDVKPVDRAKADHVPATSEASPQVCTHTLFPLTAQAVISSEV
jgi:hypothetical protein